MPFLLVGGAQSGIPEPASRVNERFLLDTIQVNSIYFRHDGFQIDSTYEANISALSSIRAALDMAVNQSQDAIAEIIIQGSSSPIGHEVYNYHLSMRRAKKAEEFLRSIEGLQDVSMSLVAKGEDWETFHKEIKTGYFRKNRDKLISILEEDIPASLKKKKIMGLEYDSITWKYLARNFMASSRYAVTIVVVKKMRLIEPMPVLASITTSLAAPTRGLPYDITTANLSHSSHEAQQIEDIHEEELVTEDKLGEDLIEGRTPIASIRTNLLVPALNVGAEVPLGNNWSMSADYYYPWIWPNQKNKNCFELLGWSLEGRYWFGRHRQNSDRLRGHSVGLYMAGGYYDFEKNYRGMQGEFLSPGLDYTYSMAIGHRKRVNLQFTLAVGYIRSWGRTYDVYGDYGELFPDEGKVIWDYVGPTKAAVSIVVPLYRREGRR